MREGDRKGEIERREEERDRYSELKRERTTKCVHELAINITNSTNWSIFHSDFIDIFDYLVSMLNDHYALFHFSYFLR